MRTIEQAIEVYGEYEGLEMQDIPQRLLDQFAVKLFAGTSLAGDKSKQDEILDTMINQNQTIQMQYDIDLIDNSFMLELAERWDNYKDPYDDYMQSEFPTLRKDLDNLTIRK